MDQKKEDKVLEEIISTEEKFGISKFYTEGIPKEISYLLDKGYIEQYRVIKFEGKEIPFYKVTKKGKRYYKILRLVSFFSNKRI